jgi:hypothetical protein
MGIATAGLAHSRNSVYAASVLLALHLFHLASLRFSGRPRPVRNSAAYRGRGHPVAAKFGSRKKPGSAGGRSGHACDHQEVLERGAAERGRRNLCGWRPRAQLEDASRTAQLAHAIGARHTDSNPRHHGRGAFRAGDLPTRGPRPRLRAIARAHAGDVLRVARRQMGLPPRAAARRCAIGGGGRG